MTDFDPTFSDLSPSSTSSPDVADWYTSQLMGGIPDTVAPYLAAQGFRIQDVAPRFVENEFAGWIMSMARNSFDHADATQDMLDRMTVAYNEGRTKNDTRYEDLISNLEDLLDKTQQHMASAKETLDDQIELHLTTLSSLESSYDTFFAEVRADLEGLEVTLNADRTRVNNQFNALLAQSRQQLMNRGFYSSAMITTIDAGIEEQRSLALTEITEREQRLKADIALRKNEIYVNVLQMRQGLVDAQMQLTNRQQEFLAYQLDTRNNLALAMFGFVERREDDYPGLGDMAALVGTLGDDA